MYNHTRIVNNMIISRLIPIDSTIFIILILLLLGIWDLYQKRKFIRVRFSKIPTLFGLPFIGIAHQFLIPSKINTNVSHILNKLNSLTNCVWVATTPFIITVDPEIIKNVISSPDFLNKARDLYSHFHNGVLNGIVVSPVKKWKRDRKTLSTFLAHNNLMSLFKLFNANARNTLAKLSDFVGKGEQDVYGVIKTFGLQLSILTIMGIKMEDGNEKYNEIVDAFKVLNDGMWENSLLSSVGLGVLARTPTYCRNIKYMQELVRSLIKQNLTTPNGSDKLSVWEEDSRTLISLALKAMRQGQFTTKDVEIESFTMFAASYETSASAAFSTLVMLAMHPDIQERVFEEIKAVFPNKVISVEYADLKKFPYLDMVIAETLRLAPPIPYIGREAITETHLCSEFIIPKDMQVIILIYELHRRHEIWGPDADRFNPENFLPELVKKRHPYSYIPFSKGVRNCLGFPYAHITLRILLITVLRYLKFSTTFKFNDIVFLPKITLSYQTEPPLSIEIRDN